jgi:hypothetical protein
MPRKPKAPQPQQQTLSVRISDGLRQRLERARQLTLSKSGEPVSTSEIAKRFLESARDDRLDVADLMETPTESLVETRRKGEALQVLSRPEWTVLALFVSVGLESLSTKTPHPVSRESFGGVVDAFLAVHGLRLGDAASPLDRVYLSNFPVECRPVKVREPGSGDRVSGDAVRRTANETKRRLNDLSSAVAPVMVGKSLQRLLAEDHLPGPEDVSRALRPFWSVLWRLAARGHYVMHGGPVRSAAVRREGLYQPPIAPVMEGGYSLSFVRGEGTEFSMLLSLPGPFGPTYPLTGYPRINEFRAMLGALGSHSSVQRWSGGHFQGYRAASPSERDREGVWFRAHDNGITFGLPLSDWATLQRLFQRAWSVPDIRLAWDELIDEYGEL